MCWRNKHEFTVEIPDELAGHTGAAGVIFRVAPSRPDFSITLRGRKIT